MNTTIRPGTFPGNTPANRPYSADPAWMIRMLSTMIWHEFRSYLVSTRGLLIRRSRVRDPPGPVLSNPVQNPRTESVGFRGRIRGVLARWRYERRARAIPTRQLNGRELAVLRQMLRAEAIR